MGKTKIEWATDTWNPVTGCTPISEGCKNCYAAAIAKRLAGRFGYPEKPNQFDVTFHADRLEEPLHWRKPRVIFPCSMGDLFHDDVRSSWFDRCWEVMLRADWHTYLLLTKRPLNALALVESWLGSWPDHIWLGVSVESQDHLQERVGTLMRIPAAKRFVSFEPLLGDVGALDWYLYDYRCRVCGNLLPRVGHVIPCPNCGRSDDWDRLRTSLLHGVIVGGESGRRLSRDFAVRLTDDGGYEWMEEGLGDAE